ncbi:hypothetical protein [Leeuwenhoekiella sp. CH_XMU1409-2]|uniref:hypothetical protein n=1 Tax=Leeuwenhoekiella sp. CH_XMU1409-2 TaxID=3107768 RepID=UPI00300BF87C
MKSKFLVIFAISLISYVAKAQFAEKNWAYFSLGGVVGSHLGVSVSADYVYDNKYSLEIGWEQYIRSSQNKPDDFSSGLVNLFLLNLFEPFEQSDMVQLQGGRVFILNEKKSIRLNIMGGLAFTSIKDAFDFRVVDSPFLTDNYTYEYSKRNTISLLFSPRIEFATAYYGLSLSPKFIYNKDIIYFGLSLNHMIGVLRPKSE